MPPRARAGGRRAASREERNLSRDVPIRAVIFDFNGTLSHDEPVLCRIYRELFAEYGMPISDRDYYERLSGLAEHAIAEICLGPGDPRIPGFIRERIDRYRSTVADGSTVTETTRAAVRFAAERAQLAIVSGAAREEIVPVVAAAGLGDALRDRRRRRRRGARQARSGELSARARSARRRPARRRSSSRTPRPASRPRRPRARAWSRVLGTQARERLAQADELVETIDVPLLERLLG